MSVALALFTASIFLSTAAVNVLAGVLTLLAAWYWARFRPWWLLRHPVVMASWLFMLWIAVREVLGGHGAGAVLASVDQFRPFLFVAAWAPLFVAAEHRRTAVYAAGAGLLLFVVTALVGRVALGFLFYPTMLQFYDWKLPPGLHQLVLHFFIRAPDLAGPMLLTGLFGALQLGWRNPSRRWLMYPVAIAATAVVFFATARRTSQIGFVLCAALFVALHWKNVVPRTRRVLAVLSLAVVAGLVLSPPGRYAMGRAVDDFVEFTGTPPEARGQLATPGGLRLHFWNVAAQVVRHSPVIGTSESEYRRLYLAEADALGGSREHHANPHNEYLHVLGALGGIGLCLYLAAFVAAARVARRFPGDTQRNVLYLYLAAVLSSALFNSMAIDMIAGHFHVLALLCLGAFPYVPRQGRES